MIRKAVSIYQNSNMCYDTLMT